MPSKIRVLDEHTINKIAAGEVIENPASVVKELVENSIDAGATEISVEIRGGGRQLIRITDNGCGMNHDDALLCLERHATSKIKTVEDILDVSTMGFRGEAIPSIASISKFTLLTSTADQKPEEGTMIIIEGGKVLQCCNAVRSSGTTIEVKSLFFNVPVRKKFQKSPNYDANEIQKVISLIALGYPEIQFELISQQNVILKTHFSSSSLFQERLDERVKDIMGGEFTSGLLPIHAEMDGYQVNGFIGQPFFNRHNRTGQFLFINRRAVQSPFLSYCVREAYGTTLSSNRHPVFVLHLKVPGSTVDVNVHPQKREVRVRQEQILKNIVIKAIQETLQTSSFGASQPSPFPIELSKDWSLPPAEAAPSWVAEAPLPLARSFPAFEPKTIEPPSVPIPQPAFFSKEEKKISSPRVLGTIQRYIIVDGASLEPPQSGIMLVDHRAAHARVLFEHLCKSHSSTPVGVQSLLIPFAWEAPPMEASLIRENLSFFNELGIKIHEIGSNAFSVDAIPTLFGNTDIQILINDMVHRIRESHGNGGQVYSREKEIAAAASRASHSEKKRLSMEEAQSLINRLMRCESPYQCPQGQPTMATLSLDDLQKLFLKNSHRSQG